MSLMNEVPDKFWSLFRSKRRELYIDSLIKINEEYQYNNYFMTMEICIQVLSNYFQEQKITIDQDELDIEEDEINALVPPATRVIRWLISTGWLKKLEDFSMGVTNVVIPDYAAVMVEAFWRLYSEEDEDTDVYIQSVYAMLFAYKNDSGRKDAKLLNSALISTKRLNKVLQNMLHNMDKFFSDLLEQNFYADLLKEHLDGYVEEVVRKKYHILKTSDNFYQYIVDIKKWLKDIEEDEYTRLIRLEEQETESETERTLLEIQRKRIDETFEVINGIERGMRDIELRIHNMDKEHMKYVRGTVVRLNYLLNEDKDTRGLMIQLLHAIAESEDPRKQTRQVAAHMNFAHINMLLRRSFPVKRKRREKFTENLQPDEIPKELSQEEVLALNKMNQRYSKKQIEWFIEKRMVEGRLEVTEETITDDKSFEKLILAYDYALRKDSKFEVLSDDRVIRQGKYTYPGLIFIRK